MFEITLISMTQIDWPKFVVQATAAIKRSPTRQLDIADQDVGVPQSFIPALAEFQRAGTTPGEAFKNNPALLRHMSFGFLVATDRETLHQILIAGEQFAVTIGDPGRMKENYIITGTLETWKKAIITCCQDGTSPESREFFNQMWMFFDKMGFKDVFSGFRRKDLRDTTFALEQRR